MSDNMHTPSNPRIPAPQESPSPDMQDNVHSYPRHSSVDSTTISTQPSDPRPLIRPRGFGFEGSKYCVPTITQSFKAHFVGPWPTFSDVPNEVKDLWFQTFSKSFRWKKDDSALIRKNWEKSCRRRLSDHLSRDRKRFKDFCPPWIDLQHWKQLLSHWNNEEFKTISAAPKRNGTSVDPTHIGGSMPFTENKDRAEDFTRLKEHYLPISSSSGSVGSSAIRNGLRSESPVIKSQLNELTSPTPTVIELANKVAELEEMMNEKDNKYHELEEMMKEKDNKYHELEERVKEKDKKYEDICNYLKQIAENAGSLSLPLVPSTLIEGDDNTLTDNLP